MTFANKRKESCSQHRQAWPAHARGYPTGVASSVWPSVGAGSAHGAAQTPRLSPCTVSVHSCELFQPPHSSLSGPRVSEDHTHPALFAFSKYTTGICPGPRAVFPHPVDPCPPEPHVSSEFSSLSEKSLPIN